MTEKMRILFLSSNPWTTSRILVDEEAREIFEKLQEGPARDRFELHRHAAIRPVDLQRLLMMYEPHIVHFSGHGSKKHRIILAGKPGRGKQVDRDGLVKVFALYKHHVRLVVLNACFTMTQARSLAEVIDYSVGAGKGIGDREGVAFAGAFYRALGFGKSVNAAFESAKAELALTRMPRTKGLGLFVRKGVKENDSFPRLDNDISNEILASQTRVRSRVSDNSQSLNPRPIERTRSAKRRSRLEIPLHEAVPNGASNLIREDAKICKHRQGRLRTQTHASPAERIGQLVKSRSSASRIRKIKRPAPLRSDSAERSAVQRVVVCSSCTHLTLTVKVLKVAVSVCNFRA